MRGHPHAQQARPTIKHRCLKEHDPLSSILGPFPPGGRGTIQGQNMILAFKPPSQNIKGPHTQTLTHTQTHTSSPTSPSFIPLMSFYLPLCKKLNKSRNPALAPESLFFQE